MLGGGSRWDGRYSRAKQSRVRKVHMETGHGNHDPSARGRTHQRLRFPATYVNVTRRGAAWIIVVSLWTVLVILSGCASQSIVGSGPLNTTPSAVGTTEPLPSPAAQTTHTSGGITATILIQGKRMGFAADCGCGNPGSGVIIDSNEWVRVATDGTGEVAGYMKSFDYNPPTAQTPQPAGLLSASTTSGSQTTYYVPSDCMTQFDLARTTGFERLVNQIGAYVSSTGNDAQLMLGMPPLVEYPATYDQDHIACSPAAGYQQATPFYYIVSMPIHVTVPFFKVSAVIAFRKQEALAHTPSNYQFEEIENACGMAYIQKVSKTVVQYRCDIGGYYRWTWTPAIARSLAAQIAGKDLASTRDILAAYPGADIFKWQGISIQLASGSTLPSDPSQIRFKIYDTVLIGTDGVHTTGMPQVVP